MALTVVLADGSDDQDRLARAQIRGWLRSHATVRRRGRHARRDHRSHAAAAPAARSGGGGGLHVRSIRDAVETVIETIQLGVAVARIELLDEAQIDAFNRYSKTNYPVAPTLFFEFHSDSDRTSPIRRKRCRSSRKNKGRGFQWFTIAGRARNALENAARGLFRGYRHSQGRENVHDRHLRSDFPPRRLHRGIERRTWLGRLFQLPGRATSATAIFTCPSSSILKVPPSSRRRESWKKKIILRALAMGGTCTGEHGIGTGRQKVSSRRARRGARRDARDQARARSGKPHEPGENGRSARAIRRLRLSLIPLGSMSDKGGHSLPGSDSTYRQRLENTSATESHTPNRPLRLAMRGTWSWF